MDEKSAIKEFDSIGKDCDNIYFFIDHLYKNGYVIISSEELRKIDGMTIFAESHGMNPFNPDNS